MGQGTRNVCVFIPFALIIVSLVLFVLIFTGDTSTAAVIRNLYFVRIDTTSLSSMAQEAGFSLQDWYTVGLWNYCSGSAGKSVASYCSPHQAFFWFNPIKVWNLEDNAAAVNMLAPGLADALNAYQTACKWLFCAYIAAIGSAFATLVVSACAFCRRLGSFVASLVAGATAVFSVGAAITATIVYNALVGFVKGNFGSEGLTASLGSGMFTLVWLSAALSVVACAFFLATACCCATDRHDSDTKGRGIEAYQKLPTPSPYRPASPIAFQPVDPATYRPASPERYRSVEPEQYRPRSPKLPSLPSIYSQSEYSYEPTSPSRQQNAYAWNQYQYEPQYQAVPMQSYHHYHQSM